MNKIALSENDLFDCFNDPVFYGNKKEANRSRWEWPRDYGFGYLESIHLRPGLILRLAKYKIMKDLSISYSPFNSYINFRFILNGGLFYQLQNKKDENNFLFNKGKFFISYLPGWKGKITYKPETEMEVVGIGISPELFLKLIGNEFQKIPENLQKILQTNSKKHSFHEISTIPNDLLYLLKEILYFSYTGSIEKIFLEGKTLELFSKAMIHVLSLDGKKNIKTQPKINSDEIEKVYEIKKILEINLQQPPSLIDLSREIGLSHPKLTSCFKQVYGKTVFEYLREMRLKKAKLLLDEGNMNITEIAYEAGYSSPSYFTKSFKNYFGSNPGEYLKKIS